MTDPERLVWAAEFTRALAFKTAAAAAIDAHEAVQVFRAELAVSKPKAKLESAAHAMMLEFARGAMAQTPCPKCGSTARTMVGGGIDSLGVSTFMVQCASCGERLHP